MKEDQRGVPLPATFDLSMAELANHTNGEKAALSMFTQSHYKWINKFLYEPDTAETDIPDKEIPTTLKNLFKDSRKSFNVGYFSQYEINPQFVRDAVSKLDQALDKGPKKQRVLYRGVGAHSPIFGGSSPEEWIDKHRQLGQHVVFDGFTSASSHLGIANDFASGEYGNKGVIFEILTPEGATVTSVSGFVHEEETLLPRNQRYVVVGVHKDVKVDKYGYDKHVVQMVAVNDKGEILDGTNSPTPPTPKFEEYLKKAEAKKKASADN